KIIVVIFSTEYQAAFFKLYILDIYSPSLVLDIAKFVIKINKNHRILIDKRKVVSLTLCNRIKVNVVIMKNLELTFFNIKTLKKEFVV
uniref:hypothetical protein n=1 Tax=Vibrio anguillarum TaxID=55601 RepID=UPI001BE4664A